MIAATPFRPDLALDLDGVPRLVAFYRERGATGLTILGIMGEAPKLTAADVAEVGFLVARQERRLAALGIS